VRVKVKGKMRGSSARVIRPCVWKRAHARKITNDIIIGEAVAAAASV
jgi:hypothetical protein